MIEFKFDVLSDDKNISTFELGDIDIVCDDRLISSRGRLPSQSMMIFIALSDLLDCVCRLVNEDTMKKAIFVGTDSSFKLLFEKNEVYIHIEHKDVLIRAPQHDLLKALYSGANKLYILYSERLENFNNYIDLKNSLANYKRKCLPEPK